MRGMLSFHMLWLLSKESMNGQEIAEELRKRRGSKPTPGTIYPALKELRTKGLVTMKKIGRTTVYSLSKEGLIGLKEACIYFCNAFGEIFQENIKKNLVTRSSVNSN
jgi:DNA-binding PadR family transcriptional regulator